MSNLKRCCKALSIAMLTSAVVAGSAYAQSVLPSQATNPAGLPGSVVVSKVLVDLGSSYYNLVSLNLLVDYVPAALTFIAGSSTLQYGSDVPVGMIAAFDALADSTAGDFSYVVSDKPGQYSLSGYLMLGTAQLSGPVTLRAAFQINPAAVLGSSSLVRFHGLASQEVTPTELMSSGFSDDSFAAQSIVSVSAVPEPAVWLMLVLGLATIALAGGKRAGQR